MLSDSPLSDDPEPFPAEAMIDARVAADGHSEDADEPSAWAPDTLIVLSKAEIDHAIELFAPEEHSLASERAAAAAPSAAETEFMEFALESGGALACVGGAADVLRSAPEVAHDALAPVAALALPPIVRYRRLTALAASAVLGIAVGATYVLTLSPLEEPRTVERRPASAPTDVLREEPAVPGTILPFRPLLSAPVEARSAVPAHRVTASVDARALIVSRDWQTLNSQPPAPAVEHRALDQIVARRPPVQTPSVPAAFASPAPLEPIAASRVVTPAVALPASGVVPRPPGPVETAGDPRTRATETAAASTVAESNAIESVLYRYRDAFNTLNAAAARTVWPAADVKALERAFDRLKEQQLRFDDCAITVRGERAAADCRGTATYVPKVGNKNPRIESRQWSFEVRKQPGGWLIQSVVAEQGTARVPSR